MSGFIDLHCHWVAGIDDGARTPEQGFEMLRRLQSAGFSKIVATPHMRPGMFDNDKAALERAFAAMIDAMPHGLPEVALSSEHFFDDVVFGRLTRGEGAPYPGGKAALVEFNPQQFPVALPARLLDLRRAGIQPVIAHPERYAPTWKDTEAMQPLIDAGACLLLDVCALVGKYGDKPKRAAETLLEEDAYEAACSDAHRAEDADVTQRAIERLRALVGEDETDRLMRRGPETILSGAWT
jgi:protein-tyrosine phosphatase